MRNSTTGPLKSKQLSQPCFLFALCTPLIKPLLAQPIGTRSKISNIYMYLLFSFVHMSTLLLDDDGDKVLLQQKNGGVRK
jgi:hypothetical protein